MSKYHRKPITYTSQLSLTVSNLQESILYYTRVIGFLVIEQDEGAAILGPNPESPLLFLTASKKGRKPLRTTGLYHFALLLKERDQLANFLGHLLEHRIPYGSADHILTEALYLNDPDGNGIEVYYDKKDTELEASVDSLEMATLPLDQEDLISVRSGSWTTLPENTMVGHMHLHVNDLDLAKEFYIDGLGFEIVAHYPGALFISDGGYHHHLGLNIWNGESAPVPPKDSLGLDWYNLVLADEEKRERIIQQLKDLSYEVSEEAGGFFTKDPAGNLIRLDL